MHEESTETTEELISTELKRVYPGASLRSWRVSWGGVLEKSPENEWRSPEGLVVVFAASRLPRACSPSQLNPRLRKLPRCKDLSYNIWGHDIFFWSLMSSLFTWSILFYAIDKYHTGSFKNTEDEPIKQPAQLQTVLLYVLILMS